jgi:hypothetical protein
VNPLLFLALGGGALLFLGKKTPAAPRLAPAPAVPSSAPQSLDATEIEEACTIALAKETVSGHLMSFGAALTDYGYKAEGAELLTKAAAMQHPSAAPAVSASSSSAPGSSTFVISPTNVNAANVSLLEGLIEEYLGSGAAGSFSPQTIGKAIAAALKVKTNPAMLRQFASVLVAYSPSYKSAAAQLTAHAASLPSSTSTKTKTSSKTLSKGGK